MANTVAYINGKGGCGKTTSLIHSTGVLAQKHNKVLVIDYDKQRNTTSTLLMENEEKIHLTVYDWMVNGADLKNVVKKAYFRSRGNAKAVYCGVDVIAGDVRLENSEDLKNVNIKESLDAFVKENGYDWVLVDMPPSSKELNDICFSQVVNNAIIPFSSDIFSVSGYADLMETINRARECNENLNILGVYLSRYMANCAVDRFIKDQLEAFGDMFINIQIPLMADGREAIMFGRPISYYKTFSKTKTAFEQLVQYMEQKIKENNNNR